MILYKSESFPSAYCPLPFKSAIHAGFWHKPCHENLTPFAYQRIRHYLPYPAGTPFGEWEQQRLREGLLCEKPLCVYAQR
ncbi:hypothetical protein ACF3DV_30050 [Chlorogloeopsis fritschii PCC 9212]|uniref:hypothetical protein n=1 Tax=Chlorogloeopsis fritschii TaxID=1124 RepID=UPI0012FE01DA|nr:hypothetical protein [Chlorogloeopsis fritschii]